MNCRRTAAALLPLLLTFAAPSRGADDIPKSLAPFFRPPPELANDFGGYASPLKFYDRTPVKTPADWPKRRREILDTWHRFMGRVLRGVRATDVAGD